MNEATNTIHPLTFPDLEGVPYAKARYHYLLQIIFGETMAIDYCRTIATFAPTERARTFLLQQQKEEDTHLELLTDYVGLHPRPEVLISPFLKKLHYLMEEAIENRDYVASIFVQNFIVEGLNVSLLRELEHHTDSTLSELAQRILLDEVKHVEFGVSEMRRILEENPGPALLKKIRKLHRLSLWYAFRLSGSLALEAHHVGIPMTELTIKTVYEHLERIRAVNFPLTYLDRFYIYVIRDILTLL